MSLSFVLNYPEFLLLGIVSVFYFAGSGMNQRTFHIPAWLANFAGNTLSSLPLIYLNWLARKQTFAGFGTNTAFGVLASCKLYPALLTLFSAAILPIPVALLLSIAAFFPADVVLLVMASKRQRRIREALPNALDLMVLCADAGLGLDATLQRVSSEQAGVFAELNEELTILARDIVLGMDRERAYQELYNRTGVDELKSFASSLNQSTKLGLSIAKILRNQAEFQRIKLSQKAEERSARLPVYMAFPLWFCIMPALMVILLAPSLIVFFQNSPHPVGFLY